MRSQGLNFKTPIEFIKKKRHPNITFERLGVAYDTQFNQVNANVPRFKQGQGLLIEEGTTNLFPADMSQSFTGAWTSGTLNGTYTVSINAGGSLTISGGANGTCNSGGKLTFTVSNAAVTFTPTGTPTHSQLELKAYPTSWVMGGITRDYERISIQKDVLNLSEFTIEIECYISDVINSRTSGLTLLEHVFNTTNRIVISRASSGAYQFVTSNENGVSSIISSGTTPLTIGRHKFAIKGNSSILKAYIDGQIVGTPILNPNLPKYRNNIRICEGGYGSQYPSNFSNTIIGAVCFSNKLRTDEDISKRGNPLLQGFEFDKYVTANVNFTSPRVTQIQNFGLIDCSIIPNIPSFEREISSKEGYYEAWPSIAKLADGTLLCSYRTGENGVHLFDPTGSIVLRKSLDNGGHWGEEITIAKTGVNLDNRDGVLLVFDDGGTETIMCAFCAADGVSYINTNTYVTFSTDKGNTWTTPTLVANSRSTACNPIHLSNGNIIFSSFNSLNDGHLYIEKSSDNGKTWSEIQIANDATNKPNETTLIEIKTSGSYTGGLIAIARNLNTSRYSIFKSADYGLTWGSGSLLDWNESTATRATLGRIGGVIVCIYTTYPDGFISIRTSYDEGVNWTMPMKLYSNGWTSLYPDLLQIGNDVGIVWCDNSQTPYLNISDIHFLRVPASIFI